MAGSQVLRQRWAAPSETAHRALGDHWAPTRGVEVLEPALPAALCLAKPGVTLGCVRAVCCPSSPHPSPSSGPCAPLPSAVAGAGGRERSDPSSLCRDLSGARACSMEMKMIKTHR